MDEVWMRADSWDDAFHCVEAVTFIRGSGVARFGIYSAVGLGFA